MRRVDLISLAMAFFMVPAAALARDSEVLLPAQETIKSEHGKAFLLDIPIYMKGAKTPAIKKKLQQQTTNQSTRGAFRSDEESCRVAFLSAAKVLQKSAQQAGGNAVVDVVSITRRKETEDKTNFRCVAGAFVVHVGLRGQIVKLK